MWNILFLFSGLLFILLLVIIFKSKDHLKTKENKIFSILTMANVITYICEIILQLLIRNNGTESIYSIIFAKLYIICIFLWFSVFSIYISFLLSKDTKINFFRKFYQSKLMHYIVMVVGSLILYILPAQYYYHNNIMYSYGISVNFLKICLTLYIFIWIIKLIINKTDLKQKKYYPLYVTISLLITNVILQTLDPSLLIATFTMTFTCYIMYFTIENPDMKLLNEVNIAKVEVEKANSAKSEFLKNMSHEIATPINKAKGMNYLIMESDDINEIKENAKVVDEYLTQLSDISKNIIDVIKLESNSLTLENNVYYPEKLFDDIEKLALRKIDTKKIEFKLKINKLPNALYGDAPKIKHIISELITNAIKYTDKGKITLSVKSEMKDNKCILFVEVKDTGIGIKKENQKELFNYFSRVDLNNNITINGMGLGLSICKQLVEMMNGKINVESEYKKGSKFYFEIVQELMEGK